MKSNEDILESLYKAYIDALRRIDKRDTLLLRVTFDRYVALAERMTGFSTGHIIERFNRV